MLFDGHVSSVRHATPSSGENAEKINGSLGHPATSTAIAERGLDDAGYNAGYT